MEHREDHGLQVVLAVVDVAEGRVMGAGEHRLRLPERPARQNARMLQGHRISFLRHDAGRLHECIRESQKPEFARRPQQQILNQLAQIYHRDRDRSRRFGQIVDRGDRGVRVFSQTLEAEEACGLVAIDRESRGRDGACAERAEVHTRESLLGPRSVAGQEFACA